MNTATAISPRGGEGRILWMDAMRGFSIILVVLGHVLLRMGLGDENTVLSSLLITFRMPLFFFVSGFFSYRSIHWWTRPRLADILRRKFTAQILAAIIFFSIYEYATTGRVDFSNGLVEYWFTIALFQMYLLFAVVSLACRRLKRDGVVIIVLAAIALEFLIGRIWLLNTPLVRILDWYKLTHYFQYFVLGLAASCYRRQFVALMASGRFCTVVVIALAGVLMVWRAIIGGPHTTVWYFLVNSIAMRYLGLSVVVIMFYGMADYWNRDTRLTRFMNYTGRRTLDIYYIHYFFLPKLLFMKRLLLPDNRFVLQLLVAGIITAMVVMMSLMVSAILRRSPLLRTFLFGLRPERRRA